MAAASGTGAGGPVTCPNGRFFAFLAGRTDCSLGWQPDDRTSSRSEASKNLDSGLSRTATAAVNHFSSRSGFEERSST